MQWELKNNISYVTRQLVIGWCNQCSLVALIVAAYSVFQANWYYCGVVLVVLTGILFWQVAIEYPVLRWYRQLTRLILPASTSGKQNYARLELALIAAPKLSGGIVIRPQRFLDLLESVVYRIILFSATVCFAECTVGVIIDAFFRANLDFVFLLQLTIVAFSLAVPIVFHWTLRYTRYINGRMPRFKEQLQILDSQIKEGES